MTRYRLNNIKMPLSADEKAVFSAVRERFSHDCRHNIGFGTFEPFGQFIIFVVQLNKAMIA